MIKLNEALHLLKTGNAVGIPTETVYGLAASISSQKGIESIFKIKERPFFDPLIVHISSFEQAKECVTHWPESIDKLARLLWPGPVTFILPKSQLISDMISSGLDTVGLRMPDHPLALELINLLGGPVAAPSANKFKKTSPTCYEHVKSEFPKLGILDGGQCTIGIESTILGLSIEEKKLLIYRPGMLNKLKLESILKELEISDLTISYQDSPVAPGHLKHHYMPKTPVILCLTDTALSELPPLIPKDLLKSVKRWILPTNPVLAARDLYSKFREYDLESYTAILIEISEEQKKSDNFVGILNRLEKAASYKSFI
jgi:L-threonylcarbamoyladenylate synthase